MEQDEDGSFCKRPSAKDDFLDLVNQSESLAKQTKRSKKSSETSNATKVAESIDADDLLDKHDKHITSILSEIRECSFSDRQSDPSVSNISACPLGFPRAFHRNDMASLATATAVTSGQASLTANLACGRKPSLFALRMRQQQQQQQQQQPQLQPKLESDSANASRPISRILTGSGVSPFAPDKAVLDISEENWRRLDSLPRDEILREKKRLEDSIDPRLLAFFKLAKMDSKQQQQQQQQSQPTVKPKQKPKSVSMPSESAAVTPQLESEKLAWTRDPELPAPINSAGAASQARFDLTGRLVPPDSNLPTHLGLHHHGDEPHRAGYSVSELFTLARSTVLQQRVLAFGVLARALDHWHRGQLSDCLQGCLPEQLQDSGLLFLCRVALDDANAPLSGLEAALNCLRAAMAPNCDIEEVRLGRSQLWTQSCCFPGSVAMRPDLRDANLEGEEALVNDTDDSEDQRESDDDLMRRDPCQGLLRTRLLARLTRLLPRLGPLGLAASAAVLTRIVRHGRRAARLVAEAPGCLASELIRRCLSAEEVQSGPHSAALWAFRLSRALCQALPPPLNSSFASALEQATQKTALALVWPAPASAEPLWLRVAMNTSLLTDDDQRSFVEPSAECAPEQLAPLMRRCIRDDDLVTAEAIAGLLDSTIAASKTAAALETVDATTGIVWEVSAAWAASRAISSLSHSTGTAAMLMRCRLSALIARYATKDPTRLQRETEAVVNRPDNLLRCLLNQLPALSSRYRQSASILLSSHRCGRTARLASLTSRRLPQLTSLVVFHTTVANPSTNEAEKIEDVIKASIFESMINVDDDHASKMGSTVSNSWCGVLLQAVLLYCLVVDKLPQLLSEDDLQLLYNSLSDLLSNGFDLAAHPVGSLCCGFIEVELRLLCEAAHLARRLSSDFRSMLPSAPSASLVTFLAGSLTASMSAELRQLFDKLLFTPYFLDSLDQSEDSDGSKLKAHNCVAAARDVYSSMIAHNHNGVALIGPLLPQDWIWLPLLSASTTADDPEATDVNADEDAVREAAACWAALLDSRGLAPAACAAARLARLLAVLSASGSPTPSALTPLVAACCSDRFLRSLDTEASVPGVASFYDAWTDALRHYQGAGYGDPHFANALLIPCGQRQHVKYRRAIWGEMSACLRVMPLRFNQLLIPLEHLLGDGERSLEMLRLYAQELFSGRVGCIRSPVPYGLAVHHLSAFLYQRSIDDTAIVAEFRNLLWSHVLSLRPGLTSPRSGQEAVLQAHLLMCDRCESPLLRLHSNGLPALRLRFLADRLGADLDTARRLVSDCIAALAD